LPAKVAAISDEELPDRFNTTVTNHNAPKVTVKSNTAPTPQNGLIVLRVAPIRATGNVVEPASLTNVEMTALSRHRAKDKSPPATSADEMSGNVIWRNARAGVAPKSAAASSSDSSSQASLARTMSVTTALA
jgi:hypothetical protein